MLSAPNAGFLAQQKGGPPRSAPEYGQNDFQKGRKPPASASYSMLLRKLLSRSLFGAPSTSAGAPCSQMTP